MLLAPLGAAGSIPMRVPAFPTSVSCSRRRMVCFRSCCRRRLTQTTVMSRRTTTSRAPTTPAMMDVTWLQGRTSVGEMVMGLGGSRLEEPPSTHSDGGQGGTGHPRSYLGFWSTGQPSSSRIVHLGTQRAAFRPSAAPRSPLSVLGPPPTHEWVQLVGQSWQTPSSSGYFQMGTKEASAFTPLGHRRTHCCPSL